MRIAWPGLMIGKRNFEEGWLADGEGGFCDDQGRGNFCGCCMHIPSTLEEKGGLGSAERLEVILGWR